MADKNKVEVKIDGDASGLKAATNEAAGHLRGLASSASGAVSGFASLATGAIGHLTKIGLAAGTAAAGLGAAFGVSAVKTFGDFEQAVNEGAAATDNFGGKRKQIEDLAISLGRDLPVSATDAARGMGELGKAAFTADEILASGEGVAKLAVAAHIDIAKSAELTAGTLRGFGLAATDTNRALDVMAATANASSIDVTDMGETFKYAASAAKAAGFSFEDVSIATGLMGNNMIKGGEAGTALRSIITRLAAPPKDAASALKELGVSAFDAAGKAKPFRDTLVDLREKFKNLSDQDRIDMGKKIAGQEALGGFLSIITATDEDFNKMRDAVDGATGALDKQVKVMNSGAKMGMENLKGSIEALQIRVGQKLAPAVNFVTGKLAELANVATAKVEPAFDKLSAIFGKVQNALTLATAGFTGKLFPAMQAGNSASEIMQNKFFKIGENLSILVTRVNAFVVEMTPLAQKIFDVATALSPLTNAFLIFQGYLEGGVNGALEIAKERVLNLGNAFGVDLTGALNTVGTFIQGTVIPAFNNIASFITGTLIPAFQTFGNWLSTNIGPIFGSIANTIQNTVLPALGKFGDFVVTTVLPKLGQLFDWVGQNIIPALEKFAAFIADPVIPVMGKIADFILNSVVPALMKIVEVVATLLAPILTKMAELFSTYVLPALTAVAQFIGDNVIPILSQLFDWFSTYIAPILKVVADVVGGALANALQGMFMIWGKIADILIGAVKLAMDGIKAAINFVIDAVNLLIDGVNLLGGAFGVHIDKIGKVGEAQSNLKQSTKELADGYNVATSAVARTVDKLSDFVRKAQEAAKVPAPGAGGGGAPPSYASGTNYHAGGAAMVHAGELVQTPNGSAMLTSQDTFFQNLARGSKVFTANQTDNMMSANRGGSTPTTMQSVGNVYITIQGAGMDAKAIANEVAKQLKNQTQDTALARVARAA